MAFIGRLHPLLIHFPIALVIAAALAEIAAMVTRDGGWRTVAVGNLRAGAVFALVATIAGWRLASAPEMEVSPLLEWHRWLESWGLGRRSRQRSRREAFAVDRRWVCGFTGLPCSPRECWWS